MLTDTRSRLFRVRGIYADTCPKSHAGRICAARSSSVTSSSRPCSLTTDLLDCIGQLYAIVAEIRGQPADVRGSIRQTRSRLLVTADDALRKLAPKSPTTKAIRYGTKRWETFTRFLDNGRLEIDNNIAERAIRPIAIGRKNWLFAGSRTGGERAAVIYSVI